MALYFRVSAEVGEYVRTCWLWPRRVSEELTAKWYGIPKVKGSQKDYYTVYTDYCSNKGDYSETFKTKLYNKYGTEYCILLEVLNTYYKVDKGQC